MKKNKLVILGLVSLFLHTSSTKTADASIICAPLVAFASQSEIDKAKSDCAKNQESNRIYSERSQTLAPYQQFFVVAGVNLTSTTTAEQYEAWLTELIGTKKKYDKTQEEIAIQMEAEEKRQAELIEQGKVEKIRKENEAQEKIVELESRVKILESQKPSVIVNSPQITDKTQAKSSDKKQQVIAQKEPPVLNIQNVGSSTGTSIGVMNESQIPTKKVGWFTRIINWLRGK